MHDTPFDPALTGQSQDAFAERAREMHLACGLHEPDECTACRAAVETDHRHQESRQREEADRKRLMPLLDDLRRLAELDPGALAEALMPAVAASAIDMVELLAQGEGGSEHAD